MPILKKYNSHPRWKQKEESSYKSGNRHIIFFLNGSTHVGQWNKDVKEGKGASMSKRKFLYEGDFLNGKRHGYGVLSFEQPDGSLRLIYRGQWENDERNGFGMQRSDDGSCYEGEWLSGQRSGKGKAWFTDGCFYQGTWKHNKVHGTGVLIFANGNWFDGEFNHGYQHGQGKYYHHRAERIQEGVWNCGVCVASTMVDASQKRTFCIPTNHLRNISEVIQKQFDESLIRAQSTCSSGTNLSLFPASNPTCL